MTNFAAIGDIHGCLTEFKELVGMVRAQFPGVPIVSLGDFLDKGPAGPECVTYAREQGILAIQANHEEWGLRWLKHQAKVKSNPGYTNPMVTKLPQDLVHLERLSPEDIAWLKSQPLYRRFGDYVLVHGGLQPGIPLDEQDPKKVIRLRWLDANNDHLPVDYSKDHGETPEEGAKYWMQVWDGDHHVVYGHEAHDFREVRVDTNPKGYHCIGIDTAVVHGGYLTALVVVDGTRHFLQVKSKEVYLNAEEHRERIRKQAAAAKQD